MKQCQFGFIENELIERLKTCRLKADYKNGKKLTSAQWLEILLDAWEKQNADK